MIDPRMEGILIKDAQATGFTGAGDDVRDFRVLGDLVVVTLKRSKPFPYTRRRIVFLNRPERICLPPDTQVMVRGCLQEDVVDLYRFTTPHDGTWIRVFRTEDGRDVFATYPEDTVWFPTRSVAEADLRAVLRHLRGVVDQIPPSAPLRHALQKSASTKPPHMVRSRNAGPIA